MIAAIALLPLEQRLSRLLAEVGGVLTIYGDNISISSKTVDLRRFENTFNQIVRSEGFRLRGEKTIRRPPGKPKVLPGVMVLDEKITVLPHALSAALRVVAKALHLGHQGLSSFVCPRLRAKLAGIVYQLIWIDQEVTDELLKQFRGIDWPSSYSQRPCRESKCACLNHFLNCREEPIGCPSHDSLVQTPELPAPEVAVDLTELQITLEKVPF
jgi:hypothetical protein